MSEKRFKVDYEVGVLDTLTNEIICDTVNAKEVVDLLNEQQATINELKEEMVRLHKMSIELMDRVIPNLRRENEQLKSELHMQKMSATIDLMAKRG